MTFQQLQYFLEVHRIGSVTKAAKNLFVSYPSVSVAIANIEKDLVMTTCNNEDSFRLVATGEVALSVLMFLNHSAEHGERRIKRENLEGRELARIPLAVCLGKDHRLANARKLTTKDLRGEVVVANYTKGVPTGSVYRMCEPKRILRVSGANAWRELARRGQACYFCVLPPKDNRQLDDRRFIPLEDACYRMYAVTNPRRPMEPEVKRFLHLLEAQLKADYPEE